MAHPIPRDDVAATLAARRELGTDYEDALADQLVDRIGRTIDERIDAKLEARPSRKRFEMAPSTAAIAGGLSMSALFTLVAASDLEVAAVLWLIIAVAAVAFLLGKRRGRP
ncbi:hypothetical protein [Sphaerisporangium sp. TRM90804]|uniref:hypothetical protein n=1 Tax=Sphaerisporangium sp. TRM90804 TaxID=3031113 RepID=UPI00244AC351|nr:hypothetical protein [Sphaerisporangium sp. TRM90804]MDH2427890.1 hypothetical protein [Sphaerisporangium sp. TRM90804]